MESAERAQQRSDPYEPPCVVHQACLTTLLPLVRLHSATSCWWLVFHAALLQLVFQQVAWQWTVSVGCCRTRDGEEARPTLDPLS